MAVSELILEHKIVVACGNDFPHGFAGAFAPTPAPQIDLIMGRGGVRVRAPIIVGLDTVQIERLRCGTGRYPEAARDQHDQNEPYVDRHPAALITTAI
jgi:hypothetical protein